MEIYTLPCDIVVIGMRFGRHGLRRTRSDPCSIIPASSIYSKGRPITAVFVPQDTHAAELIDWLHAQGVRIPEDLSVVGFDDFPNASLIAGGLTTVRQPIAEMTVQAVSNLLALIAGASVEQCRSLVPAPLITRHTTAPPAAARKRRPPGAGRT
jgi:DNA-binding LacI/PurR family transcriptional regulator